MSDTVQVRGNEFIRRVQRYAKDRGLRFEWRPDLGKGNHGILVLGDRRTVVRNPKDELKDRNYARDAQAARAVA